MTPHEEHQVILMAEDDEHDIVAARRAWKLLEIKNPLYIVNNGEECLDYLLQRGKYSDPETFPRPGLLLLDINMPRLNGLETLKQIRLHESLRYLPVIMLTTSKLETDMLKSYEFGANAFITKPTGFASFLENMKTIHDFWKILAIPGGSQ